MSIKAIRAIYKIDTASLSSSEMLLLFCLADRLNDEYGYAFPSIVQIQRDLGRGKTWVHKNINRLEHRGLIKRDKFQKKNSPPNNRYWMPWLPAEAPDDEDGPINDLKNTGSHSVNVACVPSVNAGGLPRANVGGSHGEGIKEIDKEKGKEGLKAHASAFATSSLSETTAYPSGAKLGHSPEGLGKGESPATRWSSAAEETDYEHRLIETEVRKQGYSDWWAGYVNRQTAIELKWWKRDHPEQSATAEVVRELMHDADHAVREMFGEAA